MFSNINNAIRSLAPYAKDSAAKYWLSQIQTGFRAISDRQNQLSPMYRSYSLRKQEMNLKDFIDKVCRFMENVFKRDDITIENLVDPSVALVASPSKLFPVLSNIVNNACYWILSKDERIIRFRYNEKKASLFIEDSGTGITAYDKESIFEPFVSYRPNGRGLGLAIVRRVLDSQGYSITIEDLEKTLPGACFRIDFSNVEE
jgi:signal transduction histidine kinase